MRRRKCFDSPSSSLLTALLVTATVVASVLLVALTSGSSSSFWASSPPASSSPFTSSFSSWSWRDDAGLRATSLPPSTAGGAVGSSVELNGGLAQQHPKDEEGAPWKTLDFLPSPAPSPATPSEPNNFGNLSETSDIVTESKRERIIDVKLSRLELDLARARAAIRLASQSRKSVSPLNDEYVPQGPNYHNAYAFHRSYLEMEKLFKVYVYEEGEPPLFHDGPCRSIYSMEGRFIYNMEMDNQFRTRDPEKAHVHFLPFSVTKMVKFLYHTRSFDIRPIRVTIVDYVNIIAGKYRFWNRSLGADHFMLSCHDWGPKASASVSHLYSNSIRVLCNANTSEGFNPSKDASLPEIHLKTGSTTGFIGGPSASKRPILAFFAGGLHGPIRPILLEHWKGKDNDVQVYEYLPKGVSYYDMMRKSKFCICPSGYEVASPRVVEAIYLECVPVIISESYVLPFSDVLNWKSFSVEVPVSEIPNLKKILMGIPPRQYIRMQRRVRLVQKHFVISSPPKRFDVFHMILHSIWLRRLNIRVRPED
uniref:Putative glycosyltransferase At5g03795 n=1 Tax=Anthurium amnicola TaxID=1678845 RepID=A0A1D1Z9U4_9ARAE